MVKLDQFLWGRLQVRVRLGLFFSPGVPGPIAVIFIRRRLSVATDELTSVQCPIDSRCSLSLSQPGGIRVAATVTVTAAAGLSHVGGHESEGPAGPAGPLAMDSDHGNCHRNLIAIIGSIIESLRQWQVESRVDIIMIMIASATVTVTG